ncbi:tetraprenyl-beta-curcumene synthase family protein [Oceanobacillus halophilus]|uniref:tetraprenyl-beta-curcumene synthase family protein n=1 Tax=Oceanobacillus halophilus TaxID=930130 RepID=UPI0026D46AFC
MSHVPTTSVTLMTAVYRKIFPAVKTELQKWESRAKQIPNNELRTQALASIASKRFHCQGGAVFALLAGERWKEAVRFIVAYQTISDYLDNLCDRSTSLDPNDFRLLHQSMEDALSPGNSVKDYYQLREDQEDGNYLIDLVETCQDVIRNTENKEHMRIHLINLEDMYANLQIHKHVILEERIPRLTKWYERNKVKVPTLTWYEFAAAAGSTLGIFCLLSYALSGRLDKKLAEAIYDSYFPYMQGLHILLDYFIDQQEDKEEGDLNFCDYYPSKEKMKERFTFFINQTDNRVRKLPDAKFHKMVHHGLVGLYLGDMKVKTLDSGHEIAKDLLKISGNRARFFNMNTKIYYKLSKNKNAV